MKYTIESTENGCIETIELYDGSKYTKRHIKTSFGFTCEDLDFWEQMENDGICEEDFLDKVYNTFDGFSAINFMDVEALDC